jgi:CSLREA domain-containing protein
MKLFCKRAAVGFLGLLLALSGLLVTVQPVRAANITVTTNSDEYGSGSLCSLREAITAANTNKAFGGCPAGSGTDLIVLPALPGSYYKISRTNPGGGNENGNVTGDLDITTSMIIAGSGPGVTIVRRDANVTGLNDRIFHVIQPSGSSTPIISVTFTNLSVQYGQTATDAGGGGAIYNNGANVTINASTINLNNSDNGGGVSSTGGNGSLTIHNTTINDNNASYGGGILSYGKLDVNSSLIYANSATVSGGGIENRPGNAGKNALIVNTTIAANSSPNGAGIANAGYADMEIRHVTLVRNNQGPGIILFQDSVFRSANSIIALGNNMAAGETNCMIASDVTATMTSLGGNVVQDAYSGGAILPSMARTPCQFDNSLDQLGVTSDQLALSDSLTYERNTGAFAFDSDFSYAIDYILPDNPYCPSNDQFFHPRPWDMTGYNGCDAGAYEQGSYFEFSTFLPIVKR